MGSCKLFKHTVAQAQISQILPLLRFSRFPHCVPYRFLSQSFIHKLAHNVHTRSPVPRIECNIYVHLDARNSRLPSCDLEFSCWIFRSSDGMLLINVPICANCGTRIHWEVTSSSLPCPLRVRLSRLFSAHTDTHTESCCKRELKAQQLRSFFTLTTRFYTWTINGNTGLRPDAHAPRRKS